MPKSSFFNIELLPARYGDSIWIEYGNGSDSRRIIVDGGPLDTFPAISNRLDAVPLGERNFELIVLTHVDTDHIEGLVRLFADKPLPFAVDQVWFNGWRQMKAASGLLGAQEGEFLSALLVKRAPSAWKKNAKPWVIPDEGPLPAVGLPGGMRLTLLSPTIKSLDKMAAEWEKTLKAGKKQVIIPGDLEAAWKKLASQKKFLPTEGLLGKDSELDDLLAHTYPSDSAPPNGSSIAFLAEFAGKSALFLADAHPTIITASLKRLCVERGVKKIKVDTVKVSHHGSKRNTTAALLRLIDSRSYMISSNGDKFGHPDPECIALILKEGQPEKIYFNYRSQYTKTWLTKSSQKKFNYEAVVRENGSSTLEVEL